MNTNPNLPADPWYGTSGPRDAQVMIVGESWGTEEYQKQRPFVGQSGRELDLMLKEAGLAREQIFLTNVAPDQPRDNEMTNFFYKADDPAASILNNLYPRDIVRFGLNNLTQQIASVKPKLIITCGNYATWALCPDVPIYKKKEGIVVPTGIMNTPRQGYRGSQYRDIGGYPVLPVLHPAAIMRSWHFRSTTVHDFRKARRFINGELAWDEPERHFILRPDFSTAMLALSAITSDLERGPFEISVDIETYKEHLTCIGLDLIAGAICIPFVDLKDQKLIPYWSEDEHVQILSMLRCILGHKNCSVIGQNFLYDIQYIWRWLHVIPRVSFDTMIAQHLCFPTLPKDLNYISSMYCTFHRFWKGEGKEWDKRTELSTLWRYNCKDVVATLEAAGELRQVIKAFGLEEQFQFQMRQFWLAFALMQRGILVDEKKKFSMKLQLLEKLYEIETWLEKIVPETVLPRKKKAASWYNSDKQTNYLLYEVLGLKKQHHKKTGALSVNKEALQELGNAYPFIRPVTEAISLLRTTSTFVTNFLSAALDRDGRMRCSYNVGGAYSFRLSSSENAFGRGTNLQNIPKNQEE